MKTCAKCKKSVEPVRVGTYRVACGDSTDAAVLDALLLGREIDMVFTSPPYAVGIDYGVYEDTIENLRAMLPKLALTWFSRVVGGGYAVVNFGDIVSGAKAAETDEPCEYPMALEYWPVFRAVGWLLWSRRVWCKPNARVAAPWCAQSNRAASDFEHVWTWKKPGRPLTGRGDKSQMGWIDTTHEAGVDVGKDVHGAGMATSIATRMIDVHSRPGHVVFEPFCGTGTTLVAAAQTGRQAVSAEISPAFCDVIRRRMTTFLRSQRVEVGTGALE